ncbi:MAG: beta-propeller domain-containing protein [Dehalococcoidales bacterium]|nr:beta-propeller domain-containing protein [Dehalococcoidales bacterium]
MKKKGLFILSVLVLAIMLAITGCGTTQTQPSIKGGLPKFTSEKELISAFTESVNQGNNYAEGGMVTKDMVQAPAAEATGGDATTSVAYSETNVQVSGVDEADIIKTDGKYVYAMAQSSLYIAQGYPAESAQILAHVTIPDFNAQEFFIDGDRLLVFGSTYYSFNDPAATGQSVDSGAAEPGVEKSDIATMPYYGQGNLVSIKLYDIKDRSNPGLLKSVDIEGSYLTSRKIGSDVYFVINSYPSFNYSDPLVKDIIPGYRETTGNTEPASDLKPIANYNEIGYILPRQAANFITVASLSMVDEAGEMGKTVVVGSGENVYASLANLYIAQTSWPVYSNIGQPVADEVQSTVITKFTLSGGTVTYAATGKVNGHILNQFAMDEYDGYFRIATTISGYVDNRDTSTNNVYVLDNALETTGSLEDVAPGESIYAVRFMGNRAYMVTFLHVDPLFVIDMSQPAEPTILGKLKIPGYSDYLQAYDETHLMGIGNEVDPSIDADLIHTENAVYYTAIQGVKLAIFDVSDVANPIEVYKEIIGDRGTESLAARNHKAFLFDKEKGLLVIPVTVAQLQPGQPKNAQGEYVFQGAYVYNLTLENGFSLRGKVTHYDTNEAFLKSGEYFYGGQSNITRSIYIDNVLYTLSESRLQLNDLTSMVTLRKLPFEK